MEMAKRYSRQSLGYPVKSRNDFDVEREFRSGDVPYLALATTTMD